MLIGVFWLEVWFCCLFGIFLFFPAPVSLNSELGCSTLAQFTRGHLCPEASLLDQNTGHDSYNNSNFIQAQLQICQVVT